MYATGQPFAKRWSHMRGYASLPASKDAGTDGGAPLHGPGGLLATPGMSSRKRKRWGMRLKDSGYGARAGQVIRGNLARGQGGQFTSAGNASAAPKRGDVLSRAARPAPVPKPVKTAAPKKGGGGKGRAPKAPKPTPAERQAQHDQQRAAKQTANRDAVKQAMADQDAGLAPKGFDNLMGLAGGSEPDQMGADGLITMGMAERGGDGTLRLTSAGRAAVAAANRGDAKGAIDAVSRGADRAAKPAKAGAGAKPATPIAGAMQQLTPGAKPEKAAGGGGGGSKKPSADEKKQQQAQDRAKRANATAGQVGLQAGDVQALRQAAESGGVQSDALSKLGFVGADGLTTDQGRRALSALERGDVRGYNAAVQDAKARIGRETAAAQRRQQAQGAQTRREQERQAKQQQRVAAIKRRALGGGTLTTSEIQQLQDAGAIDSQGRLKAAGSPGDYLVVEDPQKSSTWHLQVKRGGTPDHRLMGAAWAALHGGYRGNRYEGPNKGAAIDKLKALYRAEKMEPPAEKSFVVYKDASGAYRWIARSTTAYQDRDKEIIASDTLDSDSQRMTTTKQFGPLRYWHVGEPDPLSAEAPWGPGLDIGDCDYSTLIGRTRVESGTFRDPHIAQTIAAQADQYELSPGFFHPLDQPDADGVFSAIRTFERSIVPTRYGRASNYFTGLAVKESRMDIAEMERRFKAMIVDLGLDAPSAEAIGMQLVTTEKEAAAQGIAYKSDDAPADVAPPQEITIGGVVYTVKAEAAPAAEVAETKDDGMMPDMEGASEDMAEPGEEPADMGGEDVIGNMTPAEFWAQLQQYLTDLLAPQQKMTDMLKAMGDMHSELKGMYGGVAQKDDARAAELTALKAQHATLAAKIAAIEGNQPATILPDDVAEALKSAGPTAPPDPDAVEVPNDPSRPYAAIAARTMPNLYRTNPDGGFAGWQPPPLSS